MHGYSAAVRADFGKGKKISNHNTVTSVSIAYTIHSSIPFWQTTAPAEIKAKYTRTCHPTAYVATNMVYVSNNQQIKTLRRMSTRKYFKEACIHFQHNTVWLNHIIISVVQMRLLLIGNKLSCFNNDWWKWNNTWKPTGSMLVHVQSLTPLCC